MNHILSLTSSTIVQEQFSLDQFIELDMKARAEGDIKDNNEQIVQGITLDPKEMNNRVFQLGPQRFGLFNLKASESEFTQQQIKDIFGSLASVNYRRRGLGNSAHQAERQIAKERKYLRDLIRFAPEAIQYQKELVDTVEKIQPIPYDKESPLRCESSFFSLLHTKNILFVSQAIKAFYPKVAIRVSGYDVFFEIDVSGSTEGEKNLAEINAMKELIGILTPRDRCGFIIFNHHTELGFPCVRMTKENKGKILAAIDEKVIAGGLTELIPGLMALFLTALTLSKNETEISRPKIIILVTDGINKTDLTDSVAANFCTVSELGGESSMNSSLFVIGLEMEKHERLKIFKKSLEILATKNKGEYRDATCGNLTDIFQSIIKNTSCGVFKMKDTITRFKTDGWDLVSVWHEGEKPVEITHTENIHNVSKIELNTNMNQKTRTILYKFVLNNPLKPQIEASTTICGTDVILNKPVKFQQNPVPVNTRIWFNIETYMAISNYYYQEKVMEAANLLNNPSTYDYISLVENVVSELERVNKCLPIASIRQKVSLLNVIRSIETHFKTFKAFESPKGSNIRYYENFKKNVCVGINNAIVRSYHYQNRTSSEMIMCNMTRKIKEEGYWIDGTATEAERLCLQMMKDNIEDMKIPKHEKLNQVRVLEKICGKRGWYYDLSDLVVSYWHMERLEDILYYRWSTLGSKIIVATIQLKPLNNIIPKYVHDIFEIITSKEDPEGSLYPDGEITHSVHRYKPKELMQIDLDQQYRQHAKDDEKG